LKPSVRRPGNGRGYLERLSLKETYSIFLLQLSTSSLFKKEARDAGNITGFAMENLSQA
jgi:hypothetical protein